MPNHPPKSLQAYLWSVDTNDLNLQQDKSYIIHQLFAYGGIPQWQWLFKIYTFKTLQDVFINNPAKFYRPDAFNFVKNILLLLKAKKLNEENYVNNIPVRTTRSKSDLIFQKLDDIKKSIERDRVKNYTKKIISK
ncbi:hypothetical protein HY612_05495 [Candidatus Roizmanbacteria bacterium]|nr:hypothetical protein [Candidatus Roizmanbacteria bacterium]